MFICICLTFSLFKFFVRETIYHNSFILTIKFIESSYSYFYLSKGLKTWKTCGIIACNKISRFCNQLLNKVKSKNNPQRSRTFYFLVLMTV